MIIKSDSIKVFHSTICFDGLLQQIFFFFNILSKESKSVKEPPVRAQQEKVHQGKFYSSTFFCLGLKSHWTRCDLLGNKSARKTHVK